MQYDVSALLLFRDDEELIGTAVDRITRSLREQELTFELIAVDADSSDNSMALLSVIRASHPELRIITAPNPRRVHEFAAGIARGHIVWFIEPEAAARPSSPWLQSFRQARERVLAGDTQLIVAAHGGLMAERPHLVRAVRGMRTLGRSLPPGLAMRARLMGLRVDTTRAHRPRRSPVRRWMQPLLSALSS